MTLRAVLFDVGGPLNTEVAHERLIDAAIHAALADAGQEVDDDAYAAAWRRTVSSFAPDAYRAVIWELCDHNPELARTVHARMQARRQWPSPFELREGIAALLERLYGRGLLLGIVANQPQETLATLDRLGIGRFFAHRAVSGTHGFHKPDVRAFLHACEALGVAPVECVMVGDRVDNDVVPAKLLGMGSMLFRTGRHAEQQPRSWEELSDAEVHDVPGLEAAILRLLLMG
jgi:putative hydrolase of the HAD superfamily